MKAKDLKLYEKYNYLNDPTEYIYIGKDVVKDYIFLCKEENSFITEESLIDLNFDFDQIVKDLTLELDEDGYIKDYTWCLFTEDFLQYFKPSLKNKLKNILNK